MASTTKLKLIFLDGNGNDVRLTYNYADPDLNDAKVKSLMQGIIANNTIFENKPVTIKSAEVITTESTEFDLD